MEIVAFHPNINMDEQPHENNDVIIGIGKFIQVNVFNWLFYQVLYTIIRI